MTIRELKPIIIYILWSEEPRENGTQEEYVLVEEITLKLFLLVIKYT